MNLTVITLCGWQAGLNLCGYQKLNSLSAVILCVWNKLLIISNYWMRLSTIWRIVQIKEDVIHRGRRPRWIIPSEICRILHILRKLNSIINSFIIHSKYFPVLKGVLPFRSLFFCSPNITQSRSQVFSVNGLIICRGLHFWRHWFNMTKILFKFGQQ